MVLYKLHYYYTYVIQSTSSMLNQHPAFMYHRVSSS